jgi:hypothetical protein
LENIQDNNETTTKIISPYPAIDKSKHHHINNDAAFDKICIDGAVEDNDGAVEDIICIDVAVEDLSLKKMVVLLSSVEEMKKKLNNECFQSLPQTLSAANADSFEFPYRNLLLIELYENSECYNNNFPALLLSINNFIENSKRLMINQYLKLQDREAVLFWVLVDKKNDEEKQSIINELQLESFEGYCKIKLLAEELTNDNSEQQSTVLNEKKLKLFMFNIKWKSFLAAYEQYSCKALIKAFIFVYQCLQPSKQKTEFELFFSSFSSNLEGKMITDIIPENSLKLLLSLLSTMEVVSNTGIMQIKDRISELSHKNVDYWGTEEAAIGDIDKKINCIISKFLSTNNKESKSEVVSKKNTKEKRKIMVDLIKNVKKSKK